MHQGIPFVGRAFWRVSWPLGRLVGWIMWRMRVSGLRHLPPPPYVVAANHHSHLDPPVIGLALRRPIRFLALDELASANRFLAGSMWFFGAIPIPRKRVVLQAIRTSLAHLHQGGVVGVFPEGTRSRTFGEIPIKRGAGWLAARSGVPLVPVFLRGTGGVMGLDNKLKRGRIRVVVGPPLRGIDSYQLTKAWSDWIASHDAGQ